MPSSDGLWSPAAGALKDASQDQHSHGRCERAKERGEREQGRAGKQEPLSAEAQREPAAGGKDNRIGHQIAGQDPGTPFVGGRQAACDVRQRQGGDRGVEHLLERRQHHRHGDQPWIEAGTPFGDARLGSFRDHRTLTSGSTDLPGPIRYPAGGASSSAILTGTR